MDSSDLAAKKDVKCEESNFQVPLQAQKNRRFLGVSSLGSGWFWDHLYFQAGFGFDDLMTLLLGSDSLLSDWFWCLRLQVVKTRKTPLPWVGKVRALQMTRPEKFLEKGRASSKDSMLSTRWAKQKIRETKRLCAKKFFPEFAEICLPLHCCQWSQNSFHFW